MSKPTGFSFRMKRILGGTSPSWRMPTTPPYGLGVSPQQDPKTQSSRIILHADPDLSDGQRGAVWPLYPAEAFSKPGSLNINQYAIPHEDVRSTLLFFDLIDIPDQPLVGGMVWCDEEFYRVGILRRSRFAGVEGTASVEDSVRDLPFIAFEKRNEVEPGRWTLARPAQALGIPDSLLQPGTAVALTFQNALPVFDRSVELEDVLEFKQRAWPELLALRAHLDELGLDVIRNGGSAFAQSVALDRFKAALLAHIKLMTESNRAKVWRSFKASFDVPSGLAAGGEALYTGSIDMGTLAAGAISVGVKTVAGLRRKRDFTNPFEYLTSAHLEL